MTEIPPEARKKAEEVASAAVALLRAAANGDTEGLFAALTPFTQPDRHDDLIALALSLARTGGEIAKMAQSYYPGDFWADAELKFPQSEV